MTGYTLHGNVIERVPQNRRDYEACGQAEPRFEDLPGFDQDIRGVRKARDLPGNARNYLERLEEAIGMSFDLVSVGPEREAFFWHRGERTL